MNRYTSIVLSIITLGVVIISMTLWLRTFSTSVQQYRSPLAQRVLPPATNNTPQTEQVVIVLISGLGFDTSQALELPILEQLTTTGANAAVESIPPTYSQTSWLTLVTGAPSTTNDAPPVDVPRSNLRPTEIDTIFARAQAVNARTALLGLADWQRLVPPEQLDYTFFVEGPGPQADAAILEAALPLLRNEAAELIVLHFTQIDVAGQISGGPESLPYEQAASNVDGYLAQIRAAMDLDNSVLIVLSDHGHIEAGGHGGSEVEVIWQPFVMLGEGVIPGNYSDIYQSDLAPTVSVLLGTAPPTATQGRILAEMLDIGESERTISQLGLIQQRVALFEAYLQAIDRPNEPLLARLQADVASAQRALAVNNLDGALQLTLLTEREANIALAAALADRQRSEQLPRILIAAMLVGLWLWVMWRRRGPHVSTIIIGAALVLILYHSLYQLQGFTYSVSALDSFATYPYAVARRVGVSLLVGGGLVLIFLMLADERDWLTLLGTGYGFSVLVTFGFIVPFFWGYWQNGLWATWQLPNVDAAFWQLSAAFEATFAALIGLIVPWPIMLLSLLVNSLRARLTDDEPKSEAGALPGLRL